MTEEQAAKAQSGMSETAVLEQLRGRSHEELLFLLQQLMKREPDIKSLIELLMALPFPDASHQGITPGKANKLTLNLSSIRKQLEAALHYAGRGWESASSIAMELSRLCAIGDDF